ncbi:TolC family protein [Sorangium sp. So ce327]|jgi:outer membrane protein TolC|uniref:TolC family protein n=1 Tax=unclassified Sorangium TaxID=2621164 RepID=UPI003F5D86EF
MARRAARAALAAAAVSLAVRLAPLPAAAADTGGAPGRRAAVVHDLPGVLALADRNHPNVAAARAKLDQVRAQLDEARYAPFSQFKLTGGVALAPTVRGNNVFSPNTDVSLTSSLGVGWRVNIDGVVPLWTFGKITNLWDAAEANVRVNQASVEKERDAVRLDVRKAYFGLQLARDSRSLLVDVRAEMDKALRRLEEQVEREEGDPIELLKLQTFGAELEARGAEVDKYISVALAGLRFYTGVAELDIPDVPIRPPNHRLGHVTRYLTAARLYRPELAQARAGFDARSAQVRLARAQLFPDIGIALQVGVSAAPEVADQLNPFTSDPGNFFHYSAALALQWKLDLLPQSARIRAAEAQLEEMAATQRFAMGGVATEVETAYAEVVEAQKRLDAYTKAAKYGKRWLVMVQQGIDVGTMADKDLIDPAKAYATNRFNQLNATMDLDMAMSRLAKATGWDAIAPDGT